MKFLINHGLIALFFALILSACSNEDSFPIENATSSKGLEVVPDFVAVLTPEQENNLELYGEAFLPEQQKDSWNTVIDADIPASMGVFESPYKSQSRAVGIWGSYPAQYWTMIRLKNGILPGRILNFMIKAVQEIEANTNIRFYNSSKDDDEIKVGNTTIKLPNVKVNMMGNSNNTEGAGNFGLIGGEQRIWVPDELADATKYTEEQVVAFFLHAFCNAAGMFNEQQRKDRDSFVTVNLNNVKDNCKVCFDKQSKNYTMLGAFDFLSITLASSKSYSKNGLNTIVIKDNNDEIAPNYHLSPLDISFINQHYLPYIARTDNYIELDDNVWVDGRLLSEQERLQLQENLNAQRGLYGTPPESGRIIRKWWS